MQLKQIVGALVLSSAVVSAQAVSVVELKGDVISPASGFVDKGDFIVSNMPTAIDPVVVVPEPGTWALLVAGLGVVAVIARRRRS